MKENAVPTKAIDGGLPKDCDVVVGIDQSLTGFAFTAMKYDDPNKYMTWVYKSPYFGIERLADIRQWLIDHYDYLKEQNNNVLDTAMEGTLVRITIYDYFDDDVRKYPLKVPPMTLKKFAAGKGNAKKQEMLLQIYKRWGVEFNDDNAADSYALARLLGKNFYNEVEKAVAEQMKDPKYRDQPRL